MPASAPAKIPGYHAPWSGIAKAYPVAENFEALKEGVKRKRKSLIIKMPNDGPAGEMLCSHCGLKLKDEYPVNPGGDMMHKDQQSSWHFDPKRKVLYGAHYICSWGNLLQRVAEIRL